jgi:hypothetical protein
MFIFSKIMTRGVFAFKYEAKKVGVKGSGDRAEQAKI